jgi:hypothetical protein
MGDQQIGIEISRLYLEDGKLPESEQRQRTRREDVIANAQEIYLRRGGRPFELSFSFKKSSPIDAVAPIATKIAELAKTIEAHKTGLVDPALFASIPELSHVFLNATEYEQPRWRCNQCYEGQFLSISKVRAMVTAKEALSRSYRRCDAYWLLLIVDFMDFAQDQEIQIEHFPKIESKVFERIIVYKTLFGHVLEAK